MCVRIVQPPIGCSGDIETIDATPSERFDPDAEVNVVEAYSTVGTDLNGLRSRGGIEGQQEVAPVHEKESTVWRCCQTGPQTREQGLAIGLDRIPERVQGCCMNSPLLIREL